MATTELTGTIEPTRTEESHLDLDEVRPDLALHMTGHKRKAKETEIPEILTIKRVRIVSSSSNKLEQLAKEDLDVLQDGISRAQSTISSVPPLDRTLINVTPTHSDHSHEQPTITSIPVPRHLVSFTENEVEGDDDDKLSDQKTVESDNEESLASLQNNNDEILQQFENDGPVNHAIKIQQSDSGIKRSLFVDAASLISPLVAFIVVGNLVTSTIYSKQFPLVMGFYSVMNASQKVFSSTGIGHSFLTSLLFGWIDQECRVLSSLTLSLMLVQMYYMFTIAVKATAFRGGPIALSEMNSRPHLIFPGGGIYFYWQAGVCTYLKENGYDLSQVSMAGASAGALVATLSAANVDFYKATESALALVDDWNRPTGLQGVWGEKVFKWLEELLPENAAQLAMENELTVVLTHMPSWKKVQVRSFTDKKDLIKSNLASAHIPWFMDGFLTNSFRGERYIDGFIPPFRGPLRSNRPNAPTIVIDYRMDPCFRFSTPIQTIKLLSRESIWGLLEQGKKFAQTMEDKGILDVIPKIQSNNSGPTDITSDR
eukprot:CAMPEP_0198153474 /NCGR_PEP_ID=MMETSP1443-20131203/64338_1 /TAXON_ID=186043 /ORGANISM="Entomoneis sp., Strain CCMP2396" /LENGTH=541 /DNA_ID=CAMNT_0043819821 /DNA_START=199 /DNA_END=1821 /DNA_ORIENTATION=-